MKLYRSYLNGYLGEVNENNKKYYQTMANVFNVSSIYGIPLYVTKNHFMNCTEWLSKVDIRIGDSDEFYSEVSYWDDTYAIVEVLSPSRSRTQVFLSKATSTSKTTTYMRQTCSLTTPTPPYSPFLASTAAATSLKASSTNYSPRHRTRRTECLQNRRHRPRCRHGRPLRPRHLPQTQNR